MKLTPRMRRVLRAVLWRYWEEEEEHRQWMKTWAKAMEEKPDDRVNAEMYSHSHTLAMTWEDARHILEEAIGESVGDQDD